MPVKVVGRAGHLLQRAGQADHRIPKAYTLRTLNREFVSLDDFLKRWNTAERKQAIIDELQGEGIFFEALNAEVGGQLDPFDLICHLAWGQPPLTRQRTRGQSQEAQRLQPSTAPGPQGTGRPARQVRRSGRGADGRGADSQDRSRSGSSAPRRNRARVSAAAAYKQAIRELEAELYSAS